MRERWLREDLEQVMEERWRLFWTTACAQVGHRLAWLDRSGPNVALPANWITFLAPGAIKKRLATQHGPSQLDIAWVDLRRRYAEPHRAYHMLHHIAHCLDEFKAVHDAVAHPIPFELALWYHDAVYDAHREDNEARSAVLAREVARKARLNGEDQRQVVELILATSHKAQPSDPDAQLLVDIDLSILGSSVAAFHAYERQIRREYAWVPEDRFRAGRAALLRSLLARPAIYATQYFKDRYESQARGNLARSLADLER